MIEKKVDAVSLGELLIDFTDAGKADDGKQLFMQNPGGATANVLSVLSAFGHKTEFIGKVGKDLCGEFLKKSLDDLKIGTSSLIFTDKAFTTLAFVSKDKNGDRSFSFSRNPGADTLLEYEEINENILKNTKIFHVGSLSLTNEPEKSATIKAIETAKNAGAIISYDPNYRPALWKDKGEAIKAMQSLCNLTDIIKISDNETEIVTGCSDPFDAAKWLSHKGAKIVAVTMGKMGAIIYANGIFSQIPAVPSKVVDLTGAGDCFLGGLLHKFLESGKDISNISEEDAMSFGKCGAFVSHLCIEQKGAMIKTITKG